jgi:hypothetical protein
MGFLGGLFHGMEGDSLLFFFLLLVIIFCNCELFEESESLLFFFLLLVILFCSECGERECN